MGLTQDVQLRPLQQSQIVAAFMRRESPRCRFAARSFKLGRDDSSLVSLDVPYQRRLVVRKAAWTSLARSRSAPAPVPAYRRYYAESFRHESDRQIRQETE